MSTGAVPGPEEREVVSRELTREGTTTRLIGRLLGGHYSMIAKEIARDGGREVVDIGDRPKATGDRAVPGFWEGDLIIGKGGKSQIATLVERHSRFTILVRIPYDRSAERVAYLLAEKMKSLPNALDNSLTWRLIHNGLDGLTG